ncbi:MAG: hypothetical protein ICV77_05855 [Cyanobacteria bacterium Co-bin8]|nr:hypothetical protein [Cyanobacteria bacterium Co-bin8]
MGTQSTAKTIFLLVSMVGWLLAGGALMYLSPAFLDRFFPSETTHLWMQNLGQGSYNPNLAVVGGSLALLLTVAGNLIWYQRFEGKL